MHVSLGSSTPGRRLRAPCIFTRSPHPRTRSRIARRHRPTPSPTLIADAWSVAPSSQADSDDDSSNDAPIASDISADAQARKFPGAGCVANALTRIGVFAGGNDDAEAKAALNAQIGPLHTILLKTRPDINIDEVGVNDKIWHKDAVKRAIIDAGYHFTKVAIDPSIPHADLRQDFKKGKYIVDGQQNGKFMKTVGKKTRWIDRWPNESPPDPNDTDSNHPDWHMIGIENGKILDWEFAGDGTRLDCSIACLWLRPDSTPHPTKGYFRRFRSVYRVTECTMAAGECAGCDMRKKRKQGQ